ncbi:TetR/AcrR family transcriptional regulator [Christensenellaceae bacterium OttesenSCG-928-L17]|nr:TetR/AcrR family transcriptional regulator [Christensenellaceae bacterium OttesenSCG-928-L17]
MGPEGTKKLILDAALDIVRKRGFRTMSIRDICKKAGVSIGAFYHYYPSRDALLNEAFLHFDMTLDDASVQRYDAMPPMDAIRQVLLDQTEFTANEGFSIITEYYRALLQSDRREAVSPERAYYQTVRKYVMIAQREGLMDTTPSAEEISEFLVKFVRGSLVDWCLHDGKYDIMERANRELGPLLDIFRVK